MSYSDPIKNRAYTAKWRTEHPGEKRMYRVEHRAERRAYNAKWRVEHRAEWRAYVINWNAEHPRAQGAYNAKWKKEHPEICVAHTVNYQHRKRANGGNFPHAAWEHLKSLFGHRCAYCGRRMERLTQDHVVPISKGGWHFSGNIVPACQSCNSRKGANAVLA